MSIGMRWAIWVVAGTGLGLLLSIPVVRAADGDGDVVEAAAEADASDASLDHIRAGIAAESDPELRAAMEEQLQLLESGQLDFQTIEREVARGAPTGGGETSGAGTRLADTVPGGGLVGPPVDIGIGGGTTGGGTSGGDSLPPEARAELEAIFSQGTGDPSKDGHLREQAEKVFEKYGIDQPGRIDGDHNYEGRWSGSGGETAGGKEGQTTSPREAFEQWERSEEGQRTDSATREQYREMSEQYQAEFERGGGLEQRGEGFERAMTEHMAPEAREQMERFMNERESMERGGMEHGGMEREMMEREFGGPSSERSVEAPTHEYEAPTREYEAATRDYEAPTHEYEAPTREYEAPTHETEAPTRETEAPTREYEAPTHEYETPTHESETQTREYEAPTSPEYPSGDGSGMGPH